MVSVVVEVGLITGLIRGKIAFMPNAFKAWSMFVLCIKIFVLKKFVIRLHDVGSTHHLITVSPFTFIEKPVHMYIHAVI